MSTPNTAKRRLIRTVPFIDGAAPVTRLRCVARINRYDHHTRKRGFVADVRSELVERPIAVLGALLRPANPCPRPNPRQIFDGDHTLCAFGFCNKLLGNAVVRIFLEAALLAAVLLQAPFGAFGANGLQTITATLVALADPFNPCAAVGFAVAVGGKVHDPKIDTDDPFNIQRRGFFHVADRQQVKLTIDVGEVGFAFAGVQEFHLPHARNKRDGLSAVHRPDRNGRCVQVPTQNAIIIGDAAMWLEYTHGLAIQLVRIRHFAQAAYRQLCRQPKRFAARLVAELVQIELPEGLRVPRGLAHGVARGVRNFQRSQQSRVLIGRWFQFELGDQFHSFIVLKPCDTYSHNLEGRFLRRLKSAVSAPVFL